MNKISRIIFSVWLVLCMTVIQRPSFALVPDAPQTGIVDKKARAQIVEALIRELRAYYVFPEVAKSTGIVLRKKLKDGGYDAAKRSGDFASALTEDLQLNTHDLHLAVWYSDQPIPVRGSNNKPSADEEAAMLERLKSINYGVGVVEKLPGNIGYLELRGFVETKYADKAVTAAMTQLADSAALIIDLRQNGGGEPAMVAFLSSYLFDKRTHLNDLYWREGGRIVKYWTDKSVPGPKYGQSKAVYVLTSRRTFSAAEEFSYNLQNLKRATLIGEVTRGGANPGGERRLNANFAVFVPSGRAINPITKTNWEGTGVVPEILVPARDALRVAQKMAVKALSEAEKDPQQLRMLNERIATLEQSVPGPTAEALGKQPIYLRGTMNEWGVQSMLVATHAGQYTARVALTTGKYKFKVGSEDWKTVDLGGSAVDETVVLDNAKTLVEVGEDMVVEVRRPATYSFTINASTSQAPTLTVTSD